MCSTRLRRPQHRKIVQRGSQEYEARRQDAVWNSRVPDRFPDTIALPTTTDDVAELVRGAVRAGQKVAVRSGGHNWFGASLRDGGVLIDLRQLAHVMVDPHRAQAQVGAGATHKVLAGEIVAHGLGFPIGHCRSVGLGGYLLAGGMGWNLRKWGPGCWNVSGADVITADGDLIHVASSTDPELLWALRGGGFGFPGIVTTFYLDLFPLPQIATRRITFDLPALPTVLPSIVEELEVSVPGLEVSLIVRRTLRDPQENERVIVSITSFAETQAAARARIRDCLRWMIPTGRPSADSDVQEVGLTDLEGEGGWSDEFRYAVDTCWVGDRYDELGAVIAEHMHEAPSLDSRVVLAFGFLPDQTIDAAFTGLGNLTVNVYATWRDKTYDRPNSDWLRAFMSALNSLSTGTYIGEADMTVRPVTDAYPQPKLVRLETIRTAYDPRGIFHGF